MANWLALFGVKSAFAAGFVAVVVAGSAVVFKDQLAALIDPASNSEPQENVALVKKEDASPQPDASDNPKTVPVPNAAEVEKAVSVTPTFDILRIEEDGSMLVAGNAAPRAKVDLTMADGTVLASGEAGLEGDFVILPDAPLKPGDYVLILRATSATAEPVLSQQSSIITVPEAGGEVLAMISEAGKASRIMVKPKALEPQSDAKPESGIAAVAEAPKEAEVPEPKTAETMTAETDVVETAEAAKPAEAVKKEPAVAAAKKPQEAVAEPVETPQADVKQATAPQSPATAVEEVAPVEENVQVAMAEPTATAVEKPVETTQPADATPEQVLEKVEPAPVAEVPEKQPEAEPRKATPPPRVIVEAVEIEGEQVYVAGAVPRGVPVRVYIDNKFIGLTRGTSDNRFLVSEVFNLTEGEHLVRADVIDLSDGSVLSRAEVPLIHEIPQELTPAVDVAAAEPAPEPAPEPDPAPAPALAPEPTPVAVVDEPEAKPEQTAVATTPEKPAQVAVLDQSAPAVPEVPKAAAQPESEANTQAEPETVSQPVAELKQPKPSAPLKPAEVELEAAEEAPVSTPEPPEARPQPEAIIPAAKVALKAVPAAKVPETVQPVVEEPLASAEITENTPQPESVSAPAKRSPVVIRTGRAVIIKRGDNLWRISRKTYGRGIRYTTIYNANRNQIRNPHRIYVGQIFKIPEKAEQEG